jgi:uncharacterized protein YndB with AHSA1/START domain
VVVGLPLLAFIVGTFVPRDHVARVAVDLQAPADRIWALVTDFAGTPKWREDVTSVRMLEPGEGGAIRFAEQSSMGEVPFEVVSQDPPRRQVVRVMDDDQPFGGTWTWELTPTGSGTRVTLTEAGFVKSAIFRAMGLLFFSPEASMTAYLRSLARALGDSAEPRRVD